jgi:hypothetical protein
VTPVAPKIGDVTLEIVTNCGRMHGDGRGWRNLVDAPDLGTDTSKISVANPVHYGAKIGDVGDVT